MIIKRSAGKPAFSYRRGISHILYIADGGKTMRFAIQKKRIVIASAMLVAIAGIVLMLIWLLPSSESALPTYDNNIETGVMGRYASDFTAEDLENLNDLTRELGKLTYDVDEGYSPSNISEYMMHTTPQYMQKLAAQNNTSSAMLTYGVLDVLINDPDEGYALIYYLLDYESDILPRGHYHMLMVLRFVRTETGWIGYSTDIEGSVSAAEYEVIRDSVTGLIRFNFIG